MNRGYQYNFSDKGPEMFDYAGRRRKAATMVSVLSECVTNLELSSLLNVGGSAGIIDEYLSRHFGNVIGIDIDEKAIAYASNRFQRDNLEFRFGDAMSLDFENNTFEVVICSQVYEHVKNARVMMEEIYRVLKPGGVVYFAAGNRIMFNEPHYNLPLLSLIPRKMAHKYLKICGKGNYYYEKHYSLWGLKKLAKDFKIIDYTKRVLCSPDKYNAEYMIKPGSLKQKLAVFVANYFFWLVPGYIWVLKKDHQTDIN